MLKGTDLTITAESGILAYCKSCAIDIQRNMMEVASVTSGKYREYRPGRISWKVTHQVMFTTGAQYDSLVEAMEDDTPLTLNVTIAEKEKTATAYISSLKIVGRVHDILQCDISLQGTGAFNNVDDDEEEE